MSKAKVKNVEEHIAVQFNIEGEGHGIFYAEISDGKVDVQPYDYRDNDITINVTGEELITALESKAADTLSFVGNEYKITVLMPLLAAIPKARKTNPKKSSK